MISVIIPAYNSEKTIQRCVESVCNQTYRDIQILCVDDGSTDTTYALLCELAAKDNRIRVLHQENGGVSAARNLGLANAEGAYLAFVDSDDFVDPGIYQVMLEALEERNVDMVSCNYLHKCGNEMSVIMHHFADGIITGHEEISQKLIAPMIFGDGHSVGLPSLWNKLYRAKGIRDNNIFFDTARFHGEDWLFNLRFLNVAESIKFVEEPLYFYVVHKESLVGKFNPNMISQAEENDRVFRNEFQQFDYEGIRYAKTVMNAMRVFQITVYANISSRQERKMYLEKANKSPLFQKYRKIYAMHTPVWQRVGDSFQIPAAILKTKVKKLLKRERVVTDEQGTVL